MWDLVLIISANTRKLDKYESKYSVQQMLYSNQKNTLKKVILHVDNLWNFT